MGWLGKRDGETVLTGVESQVESLQEKHNCSDCYYLKYRKRSGARVCEQDQDPGPVLCGERNCEYWEPLHAPAE